MKLLALILLFVAAPSFAADLVVRWTLPTERVDGTPVPTAGNDALARTTVEHGTCTSTNAFGTKAGEISVNVPATQGTIANLPTNSTHCIRARVTTVGGEHSAWSNVVRRVITSPPPRAPEVNSTVTIQWQ
jgi:hypothetical protein